MRSVSAHGRGAIDAQADDVGLNVRLPWDDVHSYQGAVQTRTQMAG
jgi:hypothetical protein